MNAEEPNVGSGGAARALPVPWGAHLLVGGALAVYIASVALHGVELFAVAAVALVTLAIALWRFEAALAFLPLVLMNPLKLEQTGTNLILSEVVLLVIFLVWAMRLLLFGDRLEYPRQLLIPALLIIATSAVSVGGAAYVRPAILMVVRYLEVLLVVFVVVHSSVRSRDAVALIAAGLLVGGMIGALIGIYQFVTGEGVRALTRRAFGVFGGGYGGAMAMTLFLALSLFVYRAPRYLRLLAAAAAPLSAVGLLVSQTRAWIGAFVLAILVSIVIARREVRRPLLISLAVIVGLVTLVVATNGFGLIEQSVVETALRQAFRWQQVSGERSGFDLSLLLRFQAWTHGVGIFLAHPLFGIGVGNLRVGSYLPFSLTAPRSDAGFIDSQFIQMFAEAGVVAGLAWIAYLVAALRFGHRAVGMSSLTPLDGVTRGLFGCLLILFIGSGFWVVTPHHELFVLLVLTIALLCAAGRSDLPSSTLSVRTT